MSNTPLISIIIPTFNRAHLIGETLDSVLSQTYTNWECIVVDDGSIDKTKDLLQGYMDKDRRFQYHKRPDTHLQGGNGARNYGLDVSQGEYIQWFDDDDLMHQNKLEIQVIPLDQSKLNFSVCQTLVFEGDSNNIIGLRHNKIVSENPLEDFIRQKIIFLTPSVLYSRQFLISKKIYFNEELKAAQEWEFICRVLFYSSNYHVDNKPLVYIRKHEQSISYNSNEFHRISSYYLARTMVFRFLLSKGVLKNRTNLNNYFRNYFVTNYRKILFTKRKNAFLLYWNSIRLLSNFYENFRGLIYVGFVILTGKGYAYKEKFIK